MAMTQRTLHPAIAVAHMRSLLQRDPRRRRPARSPHGEGPLVAAIVGPGAMDRADAVVQITRSQHGRSFESSHGWCFYRGYVQRREQGVDRPRNPVAGRAHRPVLVADITALIDA